MKKLPASSYDLNHADYEEISKVEQAILKAAGGREALISGLGSILRHAIDDVIDTPHTGRCQIEELEKTEKTYLGTRVEIRLRALLGFPKGKLDLNIDGKDVDVKFTIGSNWMIPTEAVDQICLLIAADEKKGLCHLGLLKTKKAYLSASTNKDQKGSVSSIGFTNIRWITDNNPYPANFWRGIPQHQRDKIFAAKGGTNRLVTLFELIQQTPIHRSVVADVAQQKDYMKRLRGNGGAKDKLEKKGILLLGGKYSSAEIDRLGLPYCDSHSFISTTRSG